MKRIFVFIFPFVLLFSLMCFSQTAEQIYKKVSGTVVVIQAYNANDELVKQGSGVVINDKGYVVTNYHLLEGCEKLEVLHNKFLVPFVDIIGIDVQKDILILKIDSKKFPSIKLGDIQKISIGQRIYTIGSPLGLENTISEGIISGLRNDEATGRNFIQMTASISPGSSGGAVVNEKGELIGISTLTMSEGQNLNFAIPIDDVLAVKVGSYSNNESYKDFELFYRGYDAYEKGNYKDAINYYTSYLIKYPNDAGAYNNRGNAKDALEDYQGAIQDYNKAIEITPNDTTAYYKRGIAKDLLKDYRGAIQDYSKAIEINPNYGDAYSSRGMTKYDLEDYQGAIQDYNKAIEISPNDASTYYNRGNTNDALEDYQGAIQDYSKAIEINPNDTVTNCRAYLSRGADKVHLEDYMGAIHDYNKVIEIVPYYEAVYYKRGIAKVFLMDYRGAIQDYSKAIEINPNYGDAYTNRGMTNNMLKDYQGAIQDYNKAIEINYDDDRAYCGRGMTKYDLEDYQGAIQDYNKAIEIDLNFAMAYDNRGYAKYSLGDKDGACLDWSKAGELGYSDAYDAIKKYCNQ